jgi:hypothetical protein
VVDNDVVPTITAPRRHGAAVIAITLALALSACTTGHPPTLVDSTPTGVVPTSPIDPAGQLAGLAAAAHDRKYVAAYTIGGTGHRTLLASLATDGTWQVDVDGGALSGGANVALIGLKTGTYQCLLGGPATTAPGSIPPAPSPSPSASSSPPARPSPSGSPSQSVAPPPRFVAPACVKVAAGGKPVPGRYDPVFERIFTDWLAVLLDRDAPISVFPSTPLPHAIGACYSVEPNSVSLVPVMGPGTFCFAPDGTLTAAKISEGTLTISGPAVAPPATTTLPAQVTAGPAAPLTAP